MVQKYKFEQILMLALLTLFSLTVFTDANTFVGSESGLDWNEKSSPARFPISSGCGEMEKAVGGQTI